MLERPPPRLTAESREGEGLDAVLWVSERKMGTSSKVRAAPVGPDVDVEDDEGVAEEGVVPTEAETAVDGLGRVDAVGST